MRRLLIGDRRLRLREEGDEAKRAPVVLVHGAGSSSAAWMDVVKRLAPRRRVLAPDLPGHGQSDSWGGISLDVYRDAVGTVCAMLELERVVLVGHSLGGAVALRVALAWPERVAALVLVAAGARLKVAPEVMTALGQDYAHAPEWLGRVAYSPATPREVVERWTALAFTCPQEVSLGDFEACHGFDVRPELACLKMPALVIGGADDLLVPPKLIHEAAAGLPNARAVVVPRTGHMVFQEQPDAFHEALDPFLGEVP